MSASNKLKIYIPIIDETVFQMFEQMGHTIRYNINDADVVVFTGGADVNPMLYGEEVHERTYFSNIRDEKDILSYRDAGEKFKVGICRGGQFLNVMNGGRLWQDVNNHTHSHLLRDTLTKNEYLVSSTHHQMIRPTSKAIIIAVANTASELATCGERQYVHNSKNWDDIEVCYYLESRSLCFQPHPEYNLLRTTKDYFQQVFNRCYYKKV